MNETVPETVLLPVVSPITTAFDTGDLASPLAFNEDIWK